MPHDSGNVPTPVMIRQLARFRYELRKFLRFSEQAARNAGLTPQQHQLLLGVAGHTGRGWATISELAEFLQERHNAVVGLVDRARRRGLITKEVDGRDRRLVRVALTSTGRKLLHRLSALHRRELGRLRTRAGLAFGLRAERMAKLPKGGRSVARRPAPAAK
jgi:DNA-binding MarR family transcriptional regulator